MKKTKLFQTMFSLLMILALSGCYMPFLAPEPTATPLPTPTDVPTATLPPPTEIPTLAPTETATLPPPTPTLMPTAFIPTAKPTKAPTLTPIEPIPRDLFTGEFEGGTLSFRIGANKTIIIPKIINLRKATCKEGGKLSDTISFEPPPSFIIENAKFTITVGTQVYWTGQFVSAKRASGSITIKVKGDSKNCTVGPVAWSAVVQ